MSIWTAAGPVLTVSNAPAAGADLSACHLRSVVADLMAGSGMPPGLSWLASVDRCCVDGAGVRHVGSGVLAVDEPGSTSWWWATDLPAHELAGQLRADALELIEQGRLRRDVVEATEVSVRVDESLEVSVVCARVELDVASHVLEAAMRQLANRCAVAELLHKARLGCSAGPRVPSRRDDHRAPRAPRRRAD